MTGAEAVEQRLRAFIALVPDSAAMSGLERLLERARPLPDASKLRWIAPAKLHLTLRFLGEVTTPAIDRIAAACSECARQTPAPSRGRTRRR